MEKKVVMSKEGGRVREQNYQIKHIFDVQERLRSLFDALELLVVVELEGEKDEEYESDHMIDIDGYVFIVYRCIY